MSMVQTGSHIRLSVLYGKRVETKIHSLLKLHTSTSSHVHVHPLCLMGIIQDNSRMGVKFAHRKFIEKSNVGESEMAKCRENLLSRSR